jgi:hypothetical protein
MRSSPLPEVSCGICGKPVNLSVDLYADENGIAVHEDCYLKQITRSRMRSLRMRWHESGLHLESEGAGPAVPKHGMHRVSSSHSNPSIRSQTT